MIRILLTLLLLSTLFACAPTIKHFDDYQKQFLPQSAFMPTKEQLKGQAPKVVVFALEENQNDVATQAGLGKSIADILETTLGRNRLAELVDRGASQKLKQEIALVEMNKTGSYKGPIVADYAISGTIANAGFTSKYSAGFSYFNPKTKQFISVPPQYHYQSNVSGNIKIYELPSLQVMDSIEFQGTKKRSENVRQDGGLALGAIQIGGNKVDGSARDDTLVRQAGYEAMNDIEVDIKNFFAKKGYILEKRVNDKKTIFKISIGLDDGIKQGDQLEVIGKYDVQNPITLEAETERRIIAKGVVSDQINPKSAWIIIKDQETINKIRLGDMVKMKYKKNKFRHFIKKLTYAF